MVGAFGEVQVMDWGIAKVLTDKSDREQPKDWVTPTLTLPHKGGGNKRSPPRFADGGGIDARHAGVHAAGAGGRRAGR